MGSLTLKRYGNHEPSFNETTNFIIEGATTIETTSSKLDGRE